MAEVHNPKRPSTLGFITWVSAGVGLADTVTGRAKFIYSGAVWVWPFLLPTLACIGAAAFMTAIATYFLLNPLTRWLFSENTRRQNYRNILIAAFGVMEVIFAGNDLQDDPTLINDRSIYFVAAVGVIVLIVALVTIYRSVGWRTEIPKL